MIKKYIPESLKERYRRIRAKLFSIGLTHTASFEQPYEEIVASYDISVVIAIHDSPNVTQRCLDSLERYSANAEVILVDDGSRLRETVDLVQAYQQRNGWAIIKHSKPLGHSRSCEDGSRLASRPYLCFLNSDTIITPWSWHAAQEAFKSDPQIAVTGPSTSCSSTKQRIRRAEYCRQYWTNSQIYAFAKKYISDLPPRAWIDLPRVDGFAFFIRRSLWQELVGFDPNLPDYGNEVELCKRLSVRGFRIVWTQNSYIHHIGEASYSQIMSTDERTHRRIAGRDYINRVYGNK